MIIKVAIGFLNTDSNPLLGVHVETITTAMTGNVNFPPDESGVANIIGLNSDFNLAMVAAAGGGYALTAARNNLRQTLCMSVRNLAAYVQANGQNDIGILLSSGFPMQKTTRTPATILRAPLLQSLGAGPNTGTAAMKVFALGAQVYSWRCYVASAPTVMIHMPQTTAANTVFTGLIPSETYFFQGNAVNSAGTSDWSEPYSLIVT